MSVAPMLASTEARSVDPPLSCPFCIGRETTLSGRFEDPVWSVWSCDRCTNSFVHPLPAPEEIRHFYGYGGYGAPSYSRNSPHNRAAVARMAKLLELVAKWRKEPGVLLDVGCSIGSMLVAARLGAWRAEGIEIDPTTAEIAGRRSGARVRVGTGLGVLAPEEKFDLIVMNHWLEHTPDPGRQLSMARQHLAPGGLLLIRVPNARGLVPRLIGTAWNWFQPPVHLQYFSATAFQVKARDEGLDVLELVARQGDASTLLIELATGLVLHRLRARAPTGPPRPDRRPRLEVSASFRGRVRTGLELVSDAATKLNPLAPWEDSELLCLLRNSDRAPPAST